MAVSRPCRLPRARHPLGLYCLQLCACPLPINLLTLRVAFATLLAGCPERATATFNFTGPLRATLQGPASLEAVVCKADQTANFLVNLAVAGDANATDVTAVSGGCTGPIADVAAADPSKAVFNCSGSIAADADRHQVGFNITKDGAQRDSMSRKKRFQYLRVQWQLAAGGMQQLRLF